MLDVNWVNAGVVLRPCIVLLQLFNFATCRYMYWLLEKYCFIPSSYVSISWSCC